MVLLSSCYVTPVAPGPPGPPPPRLGQGHGRAHSPFSPGGRRVMPGELGPRSPWSPGGPVVLPREARRVVYRGSVYHTHRGVWYRPGVSGGWVVCPSPY